MTRKKAEVPEAPDTPEDGPPGGVEGWPDAGRRAALVVFAGVVAIAFPLVLFHLGAYHWFHRDDFTFLTQRHLSSLDDLFRPHDSHWSTVPVVVFGVLWKLVGFRSYKP